MNRRLAPRKRPGLIIRRQLLRPIRHLRGAALLASLLAIGSTEARAQTADEPLRRLEAGKQALNERQQAERGLQADVNELQAERERLNQNLLETARLIQRGEAQLSASEARLGELKDQEELLRGSLAQRHDKIAHLLAAMQRMGRNPPPVMITRREDALRMVRSAMTLAAAFPELRSQALELAGRLGELARIMGEAKTESDNLRAETARLSEGRTRLAHLMETKRQSLAERQAELDRVRRETAEIARNVNDLSDLIGRLDRTVGRSQTEPGRAPAGPMATAPAAPGTPEVVARGDPSPRQPATSQPAGPAEAAAPPAAARPGETPPALRGSERGPQVAIEIAPKGGQERRDFGRIEPAVPFAQMRARMQLPAQGRRVLAFGDRTQYGSQSKGLVLETRHAAQVTSPADGWVIFAGEFRTFGQLLIIDGGSGYHILLAGLSQIDVQPRQFVLAGEPVGVMASPPRASAPKAEGAPVLYIEFRKDNKPIDPDPWWLPGGSEKVQG